MSARQTGSHSVVSAAGTDAASEDGDRYDPTQFENLVQPSFMQERPGSAAQRRGGYSHFRTSRAFGSTTPSITQSRPASGAGHRLSMTHAPAVASAFLRPLSSQRLQAQRSSQRTSRHTSRPESPRGMSRRQSPPPIPSRNSLSSYPNTPGLPSGENASRPPSRGSEFSMQSRQSRFNSQYNMYSASSQYRNNTLGSTADSTRPLQRARAPSFDDLNSVYRYSLSKDMRRSMSVRGANGNYELSGKDGYDMEAQKERVPIIIGNEKNWEHFSGNTVFCWGGRLQNTRDRPVSVITALFVLLPSVLYFVFEAPYQWNNISPALPIIYAYLFYICMSSFVHASVTDPGMLPRNLHPFPKPDKNEDPLTVGPTMTGWTMVRSFGTSGGAMDVPTKYCKTCNIWRPPRAHHCRTCDSCIETQDHHCVWLNNCVGRRNYRYFFTFIGSASILAIYLCFLSIGSVAHYAGQFTQGSFGQALGETSNRVAFAMFFYGLLISLYPASLTVYHLFLIARGETTREYLNGQKFKVEDRHRPYDHQSRFRNWVMVFCRYRPPTYLRFKDAYIEGDQRFGDKRGHRQAPLSDEQQGGGLEMESIAPAGGAASIRAGGGNGATVLPT